MEEHTIVLELNGSDIECTVRVYKRADGVYLVEDIYGVVNGELHHLNLKLLYKAQEWYDKKGEANSLP